VPGITGLWRSYQDTYAALYQSNVRRWGGDEDMASWMTACALAGAVCANLVLAVAITVAFQGPLPTRQARLLVAALVAAVFVAVSASNYVAFIRHDRYREVVLRFQHRPSVERRRIAVLSWTYVTASYLAPLLLVAMMWWLEPTG
jgi:hypothetical protein